MVSILDDDRSIKLSKFARSRITPPINTLVDMDKKLPLSHKARMHESVEQSDIKNESGREIESRSKRWGILTKNSSSSSDLQSPFHHVHLEFVSNITLFSGYYELNT